MDDFDSLGYLDSLGDDELRALIAAVTSTRPALRDIHDAATGVVAAEVLPDVDPPLVIGQGTTEPGFTDGGVPTFDSVRERIFGRAGTAAGQRELDSPTLEEQVAARDEAGRRKLDEIRKSMRG